MLLSTHPLITTHIKGWFYFEQLAEASTEAEEMGMH